MLHLRVVTPPERTDGVLELVGGHEGATHVVAHRGVAVQPPGDVVEAVLARESADDVLAKLCDLGLDRDGGITLTVVDTVLSDAADAAQERAPGDSADAVVWEELVARTGEESRLNATFLAFLTIACLLAAVGIVTDSTVTLVGAMVVGPEFGPLAAVAVGLVLRRGDLTRRAVLAIAAGFPAAMLVTAVAAWLAEAAGLFRGDAITHLEQLEFIYDVGPFSVIVAMLAGAAGMLSITSTKSAALVGVFISVTTVPAAGFIAIAAVVGDWERAGWSSLQLLINLIGIVGAASLVLWVRQRPNRQRSDSGRPLASA